MADAETPGKSLTDMMQEINAHRYLQHRTFNGINGITYMLVLFAFDVEECLQAVFHDVRQPLCYYTLPMPDFKRLCTIPDRPVEQEQNENKLPEEIAADSAPAA